MKKVLVSVLVAMLALTACSNQAKQEATEPTKTDAATTEKVAAEAEQAAASVAKGEELATDDKEKAESTDDKGEAGSSDKATEEADGDEATETAEKKAGENQQY